MNDHTTRRPSRFPGRPALLLCLLLTAAGCGLPEATAETPGYGDGRTVGVVQLQELLLVAAGKGGAGRILGTFVNDSTAPVEVRISDIDDEVTVVVPAHGNYPFASRKATFDTVDARPGQNTTISVTTPAVSVSVDIPVVDGAKEPYARYMPG